MSVTVNGNDLTIEDVCRVAYENEKVEFDETADIDYEGEDELVGDLSEY